MMTTEAKKKPIIIGIAGGTGAGKSTFARSIYAECGGTGWGTKRGSDGSNDDITHLSHDDYYKDLTHLTFEERAKINFDHPSSLDTDLLIEHLKQLIEGKTVIIPRYNFKKHSRYQEGEVDDEGRTTGRTVESKKVILVEGILILSVKELTDLMDLKVYVVCVHFLLLPLPKNTAKKQYLSIFIHSSVCRSCMNIMQQ